MVVEDGGDVVGCGAKVVSLHRPGQWLDPGPLGCLGGGPSFALPAKLLHPERPVILIAGDGGRDLNGMQLETAVRFGLPLVCVVGNDGGWGQIRNPQLSFYGEARAVATSLPVTRFDLLAEALGARGVLVREPRDLGPALDKALGSSEAWCVNVVLDPAAYRNTGTVSMATRAESHHPLSAPAHRRRRARDPHLCRPAPRPRPRSQRGRARARPRAGRLAQHCWRRTGLGPGLPAARSLGPALGCERAAGGGRHPRHRLAV